jgi:hypothetical protein
MGGVLDVFQCVDSSCCACFECCDVACDCALCTCVACCVDGDPVAQNVVTAQNAGEARESRDIPFRSSV